MKKKQGGTIKNWEVHELNFTKDMIESVYPGEHLTNEIISGEVVDDPTGRWASGFHMKTSLLVSIDRKNGTAESRNTYYKLQGKESIDPIARQARALGVKITDIYY